MFSLQSLLFIVHALIMKKLRWICNFSLVFYLSMVSIELVMNRFILVQDIICLIRVYAADWRYILQAFYVFSDRFQVSVFILFNGVKILICQANKCFKLRICWKRTSCTVDFLWLLRLPIARAFCGKTTFSRVAQSRTCFHFFLVKLLMLRCLSCDLLFTW